MTKPEWGTKRFCDDCGTRFYDLNREPATCPKCGTEVKVVAKPKARRFTKAAAKPAPATTQDNHPPAETLAKTMAETTAGTADDKGNPVAKGVETNPDDVDDGDEDTGVMEDTSDLTDDGDDVSEVMEHVEQGAEDKG